MGKQDKRFDYVHHWSMQSVPQGLQSLNHPPKQCFFHKPGTVMSPPAAQQRSEARAGAGHSVTLQGSTFSLGGFCPGMETCCTTLRQGWLPCQFEDFGGTLMRARTTCSVFLTENNHAVV